jgi:nucleoporin NUP159
MSIMDGMSDTSPVGMDLDLSSTDKVMQPIPGDDLESSGPLPALMVLNNEGLLSTWWIVYKDAVKQGLPYPGLTSVASTQAQPATPATPATPAVTGFAAFGKPAFGQAAKPAFGQASTPAFGQASTPAFGQASTPAFGKPSTPAFGQASTPAFGQASTPAFGKPSAPAFGKPSTPAFGQPSQPAFGAPGVPGMGAASALGSKVSPWGQPAAQSNIATPPKGQVFGSALGGASGNATFGSSSGLGSKAPVWATSSPGSQPAFGKPSESGASGFSKFNAPAKDENKPSTSPFAAIGNKDQSKSPSSPFAAFAPSASATNKPSPLSFGFGKPSTAAAAPERSAEESKEESMDDESEEKPKDEPVKEKPAASTDGALKPSTTFGQSSVLGQSPDKPKTSSPFESTPDKSKTSSLFGQSTDSPKSPASVFGLPAKQTGFQFGKPSGKPASPLSRDSDKASKLPTLGGFKLGSTFQGDGSAKDDLPAPKQGGGSLFGAGFGNMLGEASKETKAATPIKKEPGTGAPKMDDIPSQQAEEPEDAPLPPDFTSSKPKQSVEDDIPPIAGSPPVDLGDEAGQLPASDDEEEDEDEDEDEDGSWIQDDGEGSEGDEQEEDEEDEDEYDEEDEDDEDEDESEAEEPENTFNMEKASKTPFGSRLEFPSLSHSTGDAGKLLRPASPAASTTPAGLPKGPFFAPPSKSQDSPRSPSPIRQTSSTPAGRPASKQPITVPSLKKSQPFKNSKSSSAQRPESPQVPDAGELSDEEDIRVRELLASEVEPSMDLEPFIAHQDYVGRVNKLGIAGQIEKVYRDINSMIDTLGLNARSLESFIKGHETQYKQAGRERGDLEEAEEWCLVEVNELDVVQKEIGEDLDAGKVDGVSQKLEELAELQKNATRLRTRTVDMRKQIGAHADPQQRATHRASPLTNDAQIQQNELREGVAKVQKLLQDAEEALSVLRADLAAAPSQGPAAQRVPTVEAVTNTIMKMTAMIEQKSGDVDVLEAQIRRLPGGIANLNISDSNEDFLRSSIRSVRPLERSTSGNLFGTPPATRGKNVGANGVGPLGISGMLGRFGGSLRRDNGDAEFGRSSLMLDGTPRRKMADVSIEEVRRYQDRAAQRKRVLAALKQTVEKKGTRVTGTGKN